MIRPSPAFTIVGAGLAGALMACYLGKAGRRVVLYEKRSDPRGHGQDRGRSINLALSVRGIHALGEVGLADEVLKHAIPMPGRMIHARDGSLAFQPYGKDPSKAINSVSRAGLNRVMIEAAARYPTVEMHFEHRCTGIDVPSGMLEFVRGPQHEEVRVPAELVIGADGAYSAIRLQMQKHERFNFEQEYQTHGYKELTIPPGPDGSFLLEKHALHIWPRRSFMMIALPNIDGSFTCTLFWPYEGENSFAALRTDDDIRHFFEREFPDAVPLMPDLVEDYRQNPVGPLLTVRCSPWHQEGRVVLIGDACHAVVPFLGQGMNAAFEDCSVLDECLARHEPNWEAAFVEFESRRKVHTDALADLAIDNFLEMRDHVRSRMFRLRKRWELLLHKLFGRWYIPLYTLVSFTRTPYAEARRQARRQEWVVRGVLGFFLMASLLALWWVCRG